MGVFAVVGGLEGSFPATTRLFLSGNRWRIATTRLSSAPSPRGVAETTAGHRLPRGEAEGNDAN